MVHRARGTGQTLPKPAQHQPSLNVAAMAPAPAPGHLYHPVPGVAGGGEQAPCQCNTFLDPYPSGQSAQWRSLGGSAPMSSALQHFCRVCNTQLNSCKQARIHVAGKKHEKRLAYLKFSLETSEAVTGSYSHAVPQPLGQFVPGPASVASGLPTVHSVYAYPPPCGAPAYAPAPAPAAYYFPPAPSYQSPHHPIAYHYDQQPPAPQPPASSASHSLSHYPPHSSHTSCTNRRGKAPAPGGIAAASHGVMSPSLTSGFSGSGDCSGSKSTETCSLLSVASYSSATPTSHAQAKEGGGSLAGGGGSSGARHLVQCEVCHLPFPSRAVLEHHLMGSRHARKVKAESVLRQLQENGAEFRAREATGDIRCEVCEVSVNSSHQLQAHMTGHKHKMRCARQGVAPNKTILTPASSTAPSTTPSEASAPVRSYSILVGRPQFGSRPNLYKTTATARGGGHRRSQGPGLGEVTPQRGRLAGVTSLNKLSKVRKFVRPRLKTEPGSRVSRSVKLGGGPEGGRGANVAADSTTESDDAGTSKQKLQILAKKQETDLDNTEALDEAEDSDEAKESEADQEPPPPASSSTERLSAVSHMARASQTEPLRRLSVDGCDLVTGSSSGSSNKNDQVSEDPHKEPQTKISKELTKEPRRRSVSASYSQSLISNNNNNIHNCNLCQISVNSQSQLAQHMSSNKHRRLSVALQSHMGGQSSSSGSGRSKWWSEGGVTKESLAGASSGRECNVREIPMLSMFLQRLHQHHYFPPIRDEEDVSSETHR